MAGPVVESVGDGRPLYEPGLHERDNLREIENYTPLAMGNAASGSIGKLNDEFQEVIMQFPTLQLPGVRAERGAFLRNHLCRRRATKWRRMTPYLVVVALMMLLMLMLTLLQF